MWGCSLSFFPFHLLLIHHTELWYRTQDQKVQPERKLKGIAPFLFLTVCYFSLFTDNSLFFLTRLPLSGLWVSRRPSNLAGDPRVSNKLHSIQSLPCCTMKNVQSPAFFPTHYTYTIKTYLRFSQVTCHNTSEMLDTHVLCVHKPGLPLLCYLPLVKTCAQINKSKLF